MLKILMYLVSIVVSLSDLSFVFYSSIQHFKILFIFDKLIYKFIMIS